MPISVLGKRSRSTTARFCDDIERAKKKRRPFVIVDDENINPFVTKPDTPVPAPPSTPSTSPRSAVKNVFNEARNALRKGDGKLIGRELERDKLQLFLSSRLNSRTSGSIYISGPPGSGKSALVAQVLDGLCREPAIKQSIVNCMSVKHALGVCDKLLTDFGKLDVLQGHQMSALQAIFYAKQRVHLVVLDEIDHLIEVDPDFLQQMFQWSLQKASNLILIGIANALDFTDRFLPRLRSQGVKPHLLPFMPYTIEQIVSVLAAKLQTTLPAAHSADAGFVPFVHSAALQFAARKVAAQTGDLRKAISVCIRSIDLVEAETRASSAPITPSPSPSSAKKPLGESKIHSPSKPPLIASMGLSSSPADSALKAGKVARSPKRGHSDPLAHLTVETAPRATIGHMARVTAVVFSNGTSSRLAGLNFQQKAALCSLATLEAKHRSRHSPTDNKGNPVTPSKKDAQPSAPSLRTLYETYLHLCNRDTALHPLSSTEFRDIIVSLEALSLVVRVDAKTGSLALSKAPAGTPSRKGRGTGGFHKTLTEEQRVACAVGVAEIRESLGGMGSDVLKKLLDERAQ